MIIKHIAEELEVGKNTKYHERKLKNAGELKEDQGPVGGRYGGYKDTELVHFLREHPFKTALNTKEAIFLEPPEKQDRLGASDMNNRCMCC